MTNLGIMERARQLLNAAGHRAGKQQAANRPTIGASNAKPFDNARATPRPIWMETEARVTTCHHDHSRVKTSRLRFLKDRGNVIVSFTYYAHAHIYYDDFRSPVARTQGETFAVFYNALNPRQNNLAPAKFLNQRPLSDIAMLGIILSSILALSLVRG
jgi:hypothetical protein